MILYFSATGNCRYVAEHIAHDLGDTAVSIEKHCGKIQLMQNEMLGIVAPTYAWELPINVREFLENIFIENYSGQYAFVVATYGTTPGAVGAQADRILKKHGITLNARFCIRMTDTWTPWFDLSDKEKVESRLAQSEKELAKVTDDIRNKVTGNHMRLSCPNAVTFFTDKYYNSMRQTRHFRVKDSCIGCGLCAKRCPVQAISMKNNKPVWVKDKCTACLRCLHSCPKFAVQYGSKTERHGQYLNPNVKKELFK